MCHDVRTGRQTAQTPTPEGGNPRGPAGGSSVPPEVNLEANCRWLSLLLARAHRLRFFLNLLVATSAVVSAGFAAAESPRIAVRGEGYLGYSSLDVFERIDAFQGGGAGSVSLVLDRLYVQGDVFGDAMDFEGDIDVKTVGPGLHLGWRDAERGGLGLVGTYNHLDTGVGNVDAYRMGAEGELFFDRVSLGLDGGYSEVDGEGLAYANALVSVYPVDRLRLNLRGGAWGFDQGSPSVNLGAGAEFLANDYLAPFVRWEALVPDDFAQLRQQSLVAGLTVYWGGDSPSLRAYDRTHFKPSCAGLLLVGRTC